jgi:Tfp pilus assembly protein PilN
MTALLAVMFLSASSSVAAKQRALESLQAQYAAMPALPAPPAVASELPQQRQSRVAALATALGQRTPWDRLLREVSQVVPSDVWLLTLNANSPTLAAATPAATTATAAAPTGFTITGCTYSQDSVARLLARLQVVPDLTSMTLGKSESDTSTSGGGGGGGSTCPRGMVTFVLQGNVRNGTAS